MSHIISAGTITGPHHRIRNEENQDYYHSISENGVTVITVADGAGSLELSHIGAKLAATTAAAETIDCYFDGNEPEDAIRCGIEKTRDMLMERPDKALIGCTLAVAIITEKGWAVGVVGDSFGVVSFDDDTHEIIQPASNSEFVNITKLLTSRDHDPIFRSGPEQPLALSVASDGLLQASLQDGVPLQGFWTPIVKRAAEENLDVEEFFAHMHFHDKITDDTTLVIAAK